MAETAAYWAVEPGFTPRASTWSTGRGGRLAVGADDRVPGLLVVEAVPLPLAEQQTGVGEERRTDSRSRTQRLLSEEPQARGRSAGTVRGYRPRGEQRVARGCHRLDSTGEHAATAGRRVRPGGDRPPGVADRPLQPALLLLHAGRGPRLAAARRGAHRRRGRPADRGSASSGSASARCGSPAASRWSAAGWSTSSGARAPSTPRPETLADHQRARAGPHRARRWPRPGSTGSTSASTPSAPTTFTTITRRDRLDDVVRRPGGRRTTPGSAPVKVNAVLLRGVNDDQAPELLRWCLEHGYELRFIEQMPLDAQHGWSRDGDGHRRRDLRAARAATSR